METFPLLALAALAIGAVGAAVRNLHGLLIRLDVGAAPGDEVQSETYGLGTAELVTSLQNRLNLQPPRRGEVDDQTAPAANEHAFELGIFQLVTGTVVDVAGVPAAGVTVRVHDADNLEGLACAEVQTLADGTYRAFYHPGFYRMERAGVAQKETVDVVVRVLDATGAELARSAVFAEPDPRLEVDLQIRAAPEPERALRVRGFVVDRSGKGVPGIAVEALDHDIGSPPEPLGVPSLTDNDGRFDIPYELPQFEGGDARLNGKARADLIFVLANGDGGRAIEILEIERLPVAGDGAITAAFAVPRDEHIIGIVARDDELVRLRENVDAPRGPSQFETLLKALEPLTARRPLAEFDEDGSRDITFAAREIDVDRALVHRLALDPFGRQGFDGRHCKPQERGTSHVNRA